MPANQTFIAAAVAALIASSFSGDFEGQVRHEPSGSIMRNDFGTFARGYLHTAADAAQTEWTPPRSEKEAAVQMLREALAYADLSASDLRKAAVTAKAFFLERGIESPETLRLITRHDPEDGRGYLRLEVPIGVSDPAILADLDFDLAMRVAGVMASGTEQLVVSVVGA